MKNSFNNSKNDSNYHSSFNNKSSIDLSNNLLTFQEDCARFLRTNKRMLISAFRFQAESLQDMEESILLLSILTNCANKISMIMGDTTASDLDQIVFDLVQNLSSPHMQRGDWKNTISPYTYPEIQREGINVTPPPDMVSSQTQCSLFQLDIFSQQRRMLQQCIAYLRSRKKHFFSPALKENFQQNLDVQINSLILCIDHCSYSLAAVARSSSQKLFKEALSSKINTNTILKTGAAIPRINQEDSQNQISRNNNWGDITYIKWTCSSLLFILEGALIVLYNHFKTINKQKDSKDLVNKWLRSKILINYYDSSKNKSALEQLEEVIQSTDNVGTTLFVHLILRRMRELK